MNNLEAFGTMTQMALRLGPALAQMQNRKPEHGQLSIQDHSSMLANAFSPQPNTSPTRAPAQDLSPDSEQQPELKKMRRELDGLTQRVDRQGEQLVHQTAKIDSIADATAASAKESRNTAATAAQTQSMVQEILARMGRDEDPERMLRTPTRVRRAPRSPTGHRSSGRSAGPRTRPSEIMDGDHGRPPIRDGAFVTDSEEPDTGHTRVRGDSPTPMFSVMVDKEQHNAFCELINMRNNRQAQDIYAAIDPTGSPYKDWWPRVAALRATDQWHSKLQTLGMSAEQVEDTDKEQVGKLFFQHFDSDGTYHEDPLQTLPEN